MNHPLTTLVLATAALASFNTAPLFAVQEEGASTEPEIVVIGSSVAAGWVTGREARQDLQNGWAARLERLLATRGWTLANRSVPGNDTKAVLDRIEEDLLAREPRYAIVGLSMANEGLETEDPGEVFASYDGKEKSPKSANYRDLTIRRTAWTQRAVQASREGALLPASLEVYAPMRGSLPERGGTFENLAQSTAELFFRPADLTDALARLEERIEAAAKEPRWVYPDHIEPLALDEQVLARYAGDYEVNPQRTIYVTLEKGRLILSPNGEGKTQLHAASETEFFLRVMGPPPIPVVFELDDDGKVTGMLFDEGPYQVSARRIG